MRKPPTPIKLGVILDMVDAMGHSPMASAVRALELRFEEAAAHGELDRPVELLTRVADGLPSGSAEAIDRAFRELASERVLGIFGPGVTDNCLVTQPLADQFGIPTLHFPGTEHCRSQFGFHFQLGSLSDEGPMIVRELINRGHSTVGVVRDQGPIGAEYFDYFDQACQRLGLRITSDQRVSPVSDDLRGAIGQVHASGASSLVYLGLGLVIPALATALAAAAWAPPRFMNTAFLHGYANPEALKALEGWVGVDMVDPGNPLTQAFLARFDARYGETNANPLHTCFYDMATIAVEGLRWAPVLTADGFRRGLDRAHQIPTVCGGTGTVMGFSPWDRAAYKGPDWLLFQTVTSGQYRPFPKAPTGGAK